MKVGIYFYSNDFKNPRRFTNIFHHLPMTSFEQNEHHEWHIVFLYGCVQYCLKVILHGFSRYLCFCACLILFAPQYGAIINSFKFQHCWNNITPLCNDLCALITWLHITQKKKYQPNDYGCWSTYSSVGVCHVNLINLILQ